MRASNTVIEATIMIQTRDEESVEDGYMYQEKAKVY